MKAKYYIPVIIILLLSTSGFSQEVTSGVSKIKLKTAPELVIEKIVFEDDNYNEYIDADENFFFELTVKNIGKTAAENPIVETVLLDTATRGITFKHVNSVCDCISEGPSKVVQLPQGLSVWREYDKLIFTYRVEQETRYYFSYDSIPERVRIAESEITLFFKVIEEQDTV